MPVYSPQGHEETERGGGVQKFHFDQNIFQQDIYHSFTFSLISPLFQVSQNLTMLTYVKIRKMCQNDQL